MGISMADGEKGGTCTFLHSVVGNRRLCIQFKFWAMRPSISEVK